MRKQAGRENMTEEKRQDLDINQRLLKGIVGYY